MQPNIKLLPYLKHEKIVLGGLEGRQTNHTVLPSVITMSYCKVTRLDPFVFFSLAVLVLTVDDLLVIHD